MIPTFKSVTDLQAWLYANKSTLIAQKKAQVKNADAFACAMLFAIEENKLVDKSKPEPLKDATSIDVVAVINTTKLFDSHGDVHFNGLWDKSINEAKSNYLVKEHNFTFDGIVSDNVKVSAPIVSWKSLGYDYSGDTQALTYSAIITNEDKTGMFDRYKNGKVNQHSVGMRYVKLDLALPMKKYEAEYKVWKEKFDQIVNGSEAEKAGFFWAVTEAKNNEGSAVLRGSNFATPTISVQQSKGQPLLSTDEEPRKSTHKEMLKHYNPSKYIN